jgi:hypothetical protein
VAKVTGLGEDWDEDIHVVPRNDTVDHWTTVHCWCQPERDNEQLNVVVHNSADGREAYERGLRKPH